MGTTEQFQSAYGMRLLTSIQTKAQLLPSGKLEHLPPEDNNYLWMTACINTISCAGHSTGQDHSGVPGTHAHNVNRKEAEVLMQM